MNIRVGVATLACLLSSTAAAANECGLDFEEANFSSISSEIGAKALDEHGEDFVSPSPRKNKKLPWTLSTKEDIAELVEDIFRENDKATRDGSTDLAVVTKELSADRIAWWDDNTGTFVVFDPRNEDCGTAYRPEKGKKEYDDAT